MCRQLRMMMMMMRQTKRLAGQNSTTLLPINLITSFQWGSTCYCCCDCFVGTPVRRHSWCAEVQWGAEVAPVGLLSHLPNQIEWIVGLLLSPATTETPGTVSPRRRSTRNIKQRTEWSTAHTQTLSTVDCQLLRRCQCVSVCVSECEWVRVSACNVWVHFYSHRTPERVWEKWAAAERNHHNYSS